MNNYTKYCTNEQIHDCVGPIYSLFQMEIEIPRILTPSLLKNSRQSEVCKQIWATEPLR